jgi:hypothetical protein
MDHGNWNETEIIEIILYHHDETCQKEMNNQIEIFLPEIYQEEMEIFLPEICQEEMGQLETWRHHEMDPVSFLEIRSVTIQEINNNRFEVIKEKHIYDKMIDTNRLVEDHHWEVVAIAVF